MFWFILLLLFVVDHDYKKKKVEVGAWLVCVCQVGGLKHIAMPTTHTTQTYNIDDDDSRLGDHFGSRR